ncbi:MAG: hypothetical protein AAGA17_01315 [Actinomycetota bacterium]
MTNRTTRRARTGAILLAGAAFLAACGDSDEAEPAATTASESMDDMEMDDMDMEGDEHEGHDMDDMDMDGMSMNMGDPEATPAEEVPGADLATGEFVLLDTRPSGYDDLSGTATIARHDGGTTVTVRLEGLPPGEQMISHVHAASCAEGGGDHYMFDLDGPEVPPNEIHLRFDAAEDGSGFMTAENEMVAGADAVSFVVHPLDLIDNKIACVDFEPVELEASGDEGASGEAIEAVDVVALDVVGGEVAGGPERISVDLGSNVSVQVTADLEEEVHVHGYDLFGDVAPDQLAQIDFVADVPGVFEIELEGSGTLLAQLEVS